MDSEKKKVETDVNKSKPLEFSMGDIKSSAVVKCPTSEVPTRFLKLTTKTDLNQPPANWLRRSAKVPGRYLTCNSHKAFSSFSMANSFPDCVGEVDVVSDAENIKKLLKIPFSKTHVSMMVHRIGKTLLLDEFDVHSHLLRASQKQWEWLRKFYYEHILESLQENEKCLRKNKSRDYLQHKNMLSKFLHYSTMDEKEMQEEEEEEEEEEIVDTDKEDDEEERNFERTKVSSPIRSFLSKDLQETHSTPHEEAGQEFLRNVLWTFEDIRMLIGSDLPIFGGGTHPVVTLRLRDVQKPINVLTGLDYWLDNLMCNVPDVFMCYHLNGIVQQYELIKTEDIPELKGSHFSPKVVKDVAQNILSFLKAKATKSGHTYWLFRGKNEDIVKLYDLTTLCEDADAENNPFTLPVAMLLYRVARNMKEGAHPLSNLKEEDSSGKERGGTKTRDTIHKLLLNCLTLINSKDHPQIVASVHSLLTELYVPDNLDPSYLGSQSVSSDDCHFEPSESESSASCSETDEDELEEEDISSLEVRTLCVPCKYETPKDEGQKVPLGKDWEDRCKAALKHVLQGLDCLQKSRLREPRLRKSHPVCSVFPEEPEEEVTHFGSRAHSIPLPFEPLQRKKLEEGDLGSLAMQHIIKQWQAPCSARLLAKGAQAYAALAELSLLKGHIGSALRKIRLACMLYESAACVDGVTEGSPSLLAGLLSLTGDCHALLCKEGSESQAVHLEHFRQGSSLDDQIVKHCERGEADSVYSCCWQWCMDGVEKQLLQSSRCYKSAMDILSAPNSDLSEARREKTDTEQRRWERLATRGANVCNELGVHYMNSAMRVWTQQGGLKSQTASQNPDLCSLLRESREQLQQGLEGFRSLDDRLNQALLHSNLARLSRLEATLAVPFDLSSGQRKEFSQAESKKHKEAASHYRQALSLLEDGGQPFLLDSVRWDLCSTLFSAACLLQDYAPLSRNAQEKVEEEVCEWLQRALQLCQESPPNSARYPLYQYRMAGVLHRMASLHHHAYRNQVLDERRRKQQRDSADECYARSANLFCEMGNNQEFLRVLLERIALWEHIIARQTGFSSRVKSLLTVLGQVTLAQPLLIQMSNTLASVQQGEETSEDQHNASLEEANQSQEEEDQVERLLSLLQQRLIFLVQSLVKAYNSKANKYGPALGAWNKIRDHLTATSQSSGSQTNLQKTLEILQLIEAALQASL